ncbi:hypothetical protein [Pseudomonas syringae]|uniref:hypothetical protein n=1 Tax=Pseudomonas syringae TaxID=317 RepID=UPI00245A7600|nr:hypothetical protein [Pseudomonas syringae]MDH4602475.1 hypothetical protein [Pseudomonas syringae pv. papulans]
MNSTALDSIDLTLVTGSVHRIMSEKMHAVILKAIMDAAKNIGWQFAYTKEVHELSTWHRQHIAEAIWPARESFLCPRLEKNNPETFKRWAAEALEEGWSANWLDHTLSALREIGIRPVPCIMSPGK